MRTGSGACGPGPVPSAGGSAAEIWTCHCPWTRRPPLSPPQPPAHPQPCPPSSRTPPCPHLSHCCALLFPLPRVPSTLAPQLHSSSTSCGPGTFRIKPPSHPLQEPLLLSHLQTQTQRHGETKPRAWGRPAAAHQHGVPLTAAPPACPLTSTRDGVPQPDSPEQGPSSIHTGWLLSTPPSFQTRQCPRRPGQVRVSSRPDPEKCCYSKEISQWV